jgi:hypothetical protein
LADIQKLSIAQALSVFKEQDSQVQVETVASPAAGSEGSSVEREACPRLADHGENTNVAQIRAQLDNARWDLT